MSVSEISMLISKMIHGENQIEIVAIGPNDLLVLCKAIQTSLTKNNLETRSVPYIYGSGDLSLFKNVFAYCQIWQYP